MGIRFFLLATAVLLPGSAAFSITGTIECRGLRDCSNAVVFVNRIEGKTFAPSEQPAVMDQKGKAFIPRVLPVLAGTTVSFHNSDPIAHNVFTPDKCAGAFNLGTWEAGEVRTQTLDQVCEAVILCRLHPEMSGYVIALPTPYFAVTDSDGTFAIPNVPDGTYTVTVWHERLKRQSRPVTVNGGGATVDFTLTR